MSSHLGADPATRARRRSTSEPGLPSAADPVAAASRRAHPDSLVRPLWPWLLVLVLATAFCREALLPGRALLATNPATIPPWAGEPSEAAPLEPSNGLMNDVLILTLPGRVYNHQMLRAGRIPFWNPYVFCGYPHLALIQNNALYPLSAPFDWLEPLAGIGWSIWLHLALAGGLMYAFLRRSGLVPGAAVVGAAAFELNGMFLVRVSAPSYVFSGAWLPLLLLGARGVAGARGMPATGHLRGAGAILGGTALGVLGGHPQITSLCLTIAAAYAGWLAIAEAEGDRTAQPEPRAGGARRALRVVRALGMFAVLALLGVGLAGFQVLPFLELMAHSARRAVSLEAYRTSVLPFPGLLQAIVPDLFGHPVEGGWWLAEQGHLIDGVRAADRHWTLNYTGENLFTGVAPLLLAAIAVARSRRRAEVGFFALLAVASLGVLLGTPLLDLAYHALPGFRHSRPDRIVFPYMAALAVLAGYGVDALASAAPSLARASRPHTGGARLVPGLLAAAVLAVLAWPIAPALVHPARRAALWLWLSGATQRWTAESAVIVIEAAAAVLVLAIGALLVRSRRAGGPLVIATWLVLIAAPLLVFGWRFNPVQRTPRFGETATERAVLAELGGRDPAVGTATASAAGAAGGGGQAHGAVGSAGGDEGQGAAGVRDDRRQGQGRVARLLSPGFRQLLPANLVQLLGVRDVNGASAAAVDGYFGLIDAADGGAFLKEKYFRAFRDPRVAEGRLLDLLGARVVLSSQELSGRYEPLVREDGATVYRNPGALPRFFLVRRWEVEPDLERARQRVLAPDFDPATTVVLEREPAVAGAAGALGAGEPAGRGASRPAASTGGAALDAAAERAGGLPSTEVGSVAVESEEAHAIRLVVQAPLGGVLASSEVLYPGWESRLDGQPVDTLRVDAAFRGVEIPPGRHRVEMIFVPRSFRRGLAASLASALLAAALWWWVGARRARRTGVVEASRGTAGPCDGTAHA